jgi:acyl-CoA thioester hydrolase
MQNPHQTSDQSSPEHLADSQTANRPSGAKDAIPFVRGDAFRLLLRVRFGECDMQGVVFNPRYLDYVDIAITEYLRVIWGGVDDLLSRDIDSQTVRQAIDWKGSARVDEILVILMDTARIGTTSFAIHSEFRRFESGDLIARAESVYVLISAAKRTKAEIPGKERSALERGAPGVIVDFAGLGLGTRT